MNDPLPEDELFLVSVPAPDWEITDASQREPEFRASTERHVDELRCSIEAINLGGATTDEGETFALVHLAGMRHDGSGIQEFAFMCESVVLAQIGLAFIKHAEEINRSGPMR